MARRHFDVLIFRVPPADAIQQDPVWHVTHEHLVDFWVARGWIVLAREKDIRYADIDTTREDDERGRR